MAPTRGRGLERLSRAGSGRRWAEDSVELEIRHHLDMRIDELLEEGHTPEEAFRLAHEAFGDLGRHRAECLALRRREERAMRWTGWVEGWVRDLALGARSIRKSPAFSLTLLLMLGIGVGANTAIFTVVDAVLVRPLPYPDADRLVAVTPHDPENGFTLAQMAVPSALAWRDRSDVFEAFGFSDRATMVWLDEGEATKLGVIGMTPGLVDMLGVEPVLGRSIAPDDATPGAEPVALLSEELWTTRFGRSVAVLGETLTLDALPHTIIGVMPRAFRYPVRGERDLWVALGSDGLAGYGERDLVSVVARLPMGVDTSLVAERARAFQAALVDEGVETSGFGSMRLGSLAQSRAGRDTRRALWVLMGGSLTLLLIAGLNAANLLLVRGSTRRAEIGVRLALGGTRRRVVRQLAAEALLIALLSAGLAVLISAATLQSILAIAPDEVTRWSPTPIDLSARVAVFTLLLSGAVGLVFGALPLAGTVRSAAGGGIGELTTRGSSTRTRHRWRDALVVGEVALSVVLLVGAGLFVKSFVQLVRTDPGFEPEGLVMVRPGLLTSRYPEPEARRAFYEQARASLAALPGVSDVTLSTGLPPHSGVTFGDPMMAEGAPPPPGQPSVFPFAHVEPSFFSTFRVRMLSGRPFGPEDDPQGGARVIDLAMARWLFGEDAPIGKRFRMGDDGEWETVVGVAADLRLNGLNDAGQPYEILRPLSPTDRATYLTFTLRADGDPAELFAPIRQALHELDRNQPIDALALVSDSILEALDGERFLLRIMSLFAGIALTLASLGVFGVVSYLVQQRQRELGIRVALGAARPDIRRMVMLRGGVLAGLGVALGIAGAVPLGRIVESLVLDVRPSDPTVLLATAAAAWVSCLLATAVPARRATRVDPVEVLRAG